MSAQAAFVVMMVGESATATAEDHLRPSDGVLTARAAPAYELALARAFFPSGPKPLRPVRGRAERRARTRGLHPRKRQRRVRGRVDPAAGQPLGRDHGYFVATRETAVPAERSDDQRRARQGRGQARAKDGANRRENPRRARSATPGTPRSTRFVMAREVPPTTASATTSPTRRISFAPGGSGLQLPTHGWRRWSRWAKCCSRMAGKRQGATKSSRSYSPTPAG